MKSLNIMKNIDNSILNIVEKFKGTSEFQKVTDKYNLLEEHHQSIFTAILMVITITLPLIIVLVSYIFYSGVKSKVELNEQMIEAASSIIAKTRQLKIETNDLLGRPITTESILKNQISSSLSSAGIDTSNITISQFNLYENSGVNEVNASLQFKGLSSQNVYSLFEKIFIQGRYKARTINIEKSAQSQLLEGLIELSHYSKAPTQNE